MLTHAVAARSRAARVWATVWRQLAVIVIGLLGFFFVFGEATSIVDPTGADSIVLGLRMLLDVSLGLAALVLYPLRHRAPFVIGVVIVVMATFSTLAVGAALFSIVTVATRRRWREIVVVSVAFLLSSVLGETVIPIPMQVASQLWEVVVFTLVVVGVLDLVGMYIGGRRQLTLALRQQAATVQREYHAHLQQARVGERARIAREMHDVLAHRLSLVALHAGALEFRTNLTAEQTTTTAGVVRENAHLALTELREVLGLLHEPEGNPGSTMVPQPTIASLTDLLDENRRAGAETLLHIEPRVATQLDSLAGAVSRHLYRIVQEGLTNARKHAPGEQVHVRIGGEPGERVTLAMTNRQLASELVTQHPASGLGLAGLSERARLAGGALTAGGHDRGDFVLEAWLPWKK
jgi:signal transduction histidine kinase